MRPASSTATPVEPTGDEPVSPPSAADTSGSGGGRHRRILINVSANFVTFGVTLVVGLWYTPFLIRHLGVEVYGLIPLSTSIVSYFSLISIALSASIGRFVTADLARNDVAGASRTLSTFFIITCCVVAVVGPGGYLFARLAPHIFNVPSGHEQGFRWIVFGLILTFLAALVNNVFDSILWAKSRFDIRAAIELAGLIIRTGIVVVLFAVVGPNLLFVATAFVVGWTSTLAITFTTSRIIAPELRVSPRSIDRDTVAKLADASTWLLLGQIGSLFLMQMDLVLINLMLGPNAVGQYAPNLQWVTLLRSTAMLMNTVLGPTFVMFFATGDHAGMMRICDQCMKFLGLITAVGAGILMGFSRSLLQIWLGPDFVNNAPLFWLLLLPVVFEAAQYPLGNILSAQNRLKGMGLATLAAGLGNVALALALTRGLHWGLYGVATSSALMLSLRNLVLIPAYTARGTGERTSHFSMRIAAMGVVTLLVAGLSYGVARVTAPTSWPHLALVAAATAVACAIALYFIGLNRDEKSTLTKLIRPLVGRA